MEKIWNYRGRSFPFNITEDNCYTLVSQGLENLRVALNDEENRSPGHSTCDDVRAFFDTVFGNGAGLMICGKNSGCEDHIAAYVSFISFLCGQVDEFSRRRVTLEALV